MLVTGLDIDTGSTAQKLVVVGTFALASLTALVGRAGLVAGAAVVVIGLQVGAGGGAAAHHLTVGARRDTLALLTKFSGVTGVVALTTMFGVGVQVHT